MSRPPAPFYGWQVVGAASFGLCFSTGTIVVLPFGMFLTPLSDYFHATRAAISFAFTVHSLVGAVCIPLIGRLVDHFGARRVILPGTALFALVLMSSELVRTTSVAGLYLFFLLLGLLTGATSPVPYGVLVSRWFDRRRGLALGLIAVGLGAGSIVIPPVAQRLIAAFDWRAAYAALGAVSALASLPVLAAFLRDDPRDYNMAADGVAPTQSALAENAIAQGMSWRETRRSPTFWLLACAFALAGSGLFGCIHHLPALLIDRGATASSAAAVSSIVGAALLVGRLGVGYLLDRVFAPRLAMIVFTSGALGMVLLLTGAAGPVARVAAFLIGVTMGMEVDLVAYLLSRYFGLRCLGTSVGYGFAAYSVGGSLGTLLMGAVFDSTHRYTLALVAFVVAMALAAAIMGRMGEYRFVSEVPAAAVRAARH